MHKYNEMVAVVHQKKSHAVGSGLHRGHSTGP